MPQSTFEPLRRQDVHALHLTVEEYRHAATGARHLHLAADDPQNAFLVAFLTVPQDSTGVAHILEHTVLCGSQRFPVRDPFFLMLRRTLATFMNAMTASDWTAYPFASLSRKDFRNLLEVYLDAAFFPRLDPLDFAQEGWRAEPAEDGTLAYKGVVFNEMKGAMSAPTSVLWQTLSRELFPTTTYHHNSGGDPAHIPDLTYEQLKAFHARHYHPGNAVFFTYGDIPAAEHQAVFEDRVLRHFAPAPVDFAVPRERRYTAPRVVEDVYPADAADLARKTHVVVGWLLGEMTDVGALLRANLLSRVLFDNSAAPLLHALETTALGTAPSPLCGLDDSNKEMVFAAGLEGCAPDAGEAVERLVLDTLERVARDGVPAEHVEAMLHQIELFHREVGGDRYPYGLQLMMTALPQAIHGGDPVAILAVDEALARLREAAADPDFVRREVRALLDNPHRVRVVLRPDPDAARRAEQAERERLGALAARLDPGAREALARQAAALADRQARTEDPDVLPRLTRADVRPELVIPEGRRSPVTGIPATWYDRPTNGLVYEQLVLDLPALAPGEFALLPLLAEVLGEIGSGGRGYVETQGLQAAFTGGIGASAAVGALADDLAATRGAFVVSGKALARNQGALAKLVMETLRAPNFAERTRLRELIAQARAAEEHGVTGSGHALAMTAASAGFSPAAHVAHEWGGLAGLRALKALDDGLDDETALGELVAHLEALAGRLARAPMQMLVVAEGEAHPEIAARLAALWEDAGAVPAAGEPRLALPAAGGRVAQAWVTPAQVAFCARAYAAVPWAHPDAPVLAVLAQYLRNGFLHTAIRERGGAYGGGAGYDGDSGALRFYSYRDPRLEDTLADFDAAIAWVAEHRPGPHEVEEAILGVIAGIDKPGSPAGEARKAFHAALYGRTPQRRREFRARALDTTLADLRRVAAAYLDPARASTAVVIGPDRADAARALGLEIFKV
jgi:presequence protease